MARRLQSWLVVAFLTIAVGGHWAILQSAAWMGMLVRYSEETSLTEAMNKTFSGEHPCGLCKLVEKGKESGRKEPVQKADTKIDLFLQRTAVWFPSPQPEFFHPRPSSLQPQFQISPSVPPPRVA